MALDRTAAKSGGAGRTQRSIPIQVKQEQKEAENIDSNFINFTNSISLDESARTQVRVQVMRDYHRRRIQKSGQIERVNVEPKTSKPFDAKAQTQKFRIGGEEGLRPWVPLATQALEAKRRDDVTFGPKPPGKRHYRRRSGKPTPTRAKRTIIAGGSRSDFNTVQPNNEQFNDSQWNGQEASWGNDDERFYQDNFLPEEPFNQWLSNIDLSLQTYMLHNAPGNGALDPFASTSLLITPRTQLLMYQYFNVRLQSSWIMIPMRKAILTVGIHDTAMFHTLITHYAGRYNVLFRTGDTSEMVYHLSSAAAIVNERLADPKRALTEETIGAVANMVSYESSNGAPSSVIVHMNGLEKMVAMRGGLHNGGLSLISQRLVAWADFHSASTLSRQTRFEPLQFPEAEPIQTPRLLGPEVYEQLDFGLKPSLDQLLKGMGALSSILRAVRESPTTPPDDIWYSDKNYLIQRHIYDIAYAATSQEPLDTVVALAALIFCAHCLRDVPFTFSGISMAVARLKTAIEIYESGNSWKGDEEIRKKMFWILGFGGTAAEGKPERQWFVAKFLEVYEELALFDWEGTKALLESVVWQPDLDEGGYAFWMEAMLGIGI